MVLPIGFFAPLPLPMMIPFMGIQSAVMAEQFGTMFQYGKRRISAMSNEEFNALTPQLLQERMTTQIQDMIPEMKEQIKAMQPLVELILKEFGAYVTIAGKVILETAVGGVDEIAHTLGTHIHDAPTAETDAETALAEGKFQPPIEGTSGEPAIQPTTETVYEPVPIPVTTIDPSKTEQDNAKAEILRVNKLVEYWGAKHKTYMGQLALRPDLKTNESWMFYHSDAMGNEIYHVKLLYQLRKAFFDKYGYWN